MYASALLLTRNAFRETVLARSKGLCVFCRVPAQDAHHILERRLWPDGGYYLDNGAAVCGACHWACEETRHTVEAVREAAGITRALIPPHLYQDQVYDKWGNPVLPSGQRLRGELFEDASVQIALKRGGVLDRFLPWVKYPRTHHVPWSPGVRSDDRVLTNMDTFEGEEVISTEKMDGENTTLYPTHVHARSVDGRSHPSQSWVRAFHARIAHDIPEGWRVCGENLYAKHALAYTRLPSYFMGFSIWDAQNRCLQWDDTLEWFDLLTITPVPVLYRGPYSKEALMRAWLPRGPLVSEGFVVKKASAFPFAAFRTSVAKYVRANHVQEEPHWCWGRQWVPNKLQESAVTSGV